MIEELTLVNFESHVFSVFKFVKGLNLIWGPSNVGKTSAIRGMALVCYNLWEADMLRTGCESCSVSMKTEKGVVTIYKGNRNSYEVVPVNGKKQVFNSIGKTVPEEVIAITGIRPSTMGGVLDYPNFMFQLDKH